MDTTQIAEHANALSERIQEYGSKDSSGAYCDAAQAQVCEFLRHYAGPRSAFVKQAEGAAGGGRYQVNTLTAILHSFVQYLEAGLATGVSPERQAQIDVVSDILAQAQALLGTPAHHPAAAAVLVGASLEEFLRNWVEASSLSLGAAKPGIDAYCKALKAADLISKQDVKDITSWAGIRNHAAHGDWDEVSDRSRIRLMLEGVNLFMRQNVGALSA